MNSYEQTDRGIIIHAVYPDDEPFRGGQETTYEYYNIPRDQMLDMFLKTYVKTICVSIINNVDEYEGMNWINKILETRTPRELAIFRNCIYAMKGYRFTGRSWTDFFGKYLEGYSGTRTNDEVTAMLSDSEKWLLELIVGYENNLAQKD